MTTTLCTLEEFFSEDDDVPEFYICSTFTECIFKQPSLLNGRMYEHNDIVQWIRKEGTDPFSRQVIDNETSQVQQVMKSAIGLDQFMVKKVNTYVKTLESLASRDVKDEEEVRTMMKNFALFLCCIVEEGSSVTSLYREDHYIIARNFCVGDKAFLKHFEKQDILLAVMQHARNNKVVLESAIHFLDGFYNNQRDNERDNVTKFKLKSPSTEDDIPTESTMKGAATTITSDNEAEVDLVSVISELSGGEMCVVPDGAPPNLRSIIALSQYLIPKLKSCTSVDMPVLYYTTEIYKRAYKGFLQKSKPRVLVITRRSVAVYKEGNHKELQTLLNRSSGSTLKDIQSLCISRKSSALDQPKFRDEILFDSGVVTTHVTKKESGSFRVSNSQIIVADALGKKRWIIEGKKSVIREIAYMVNYISLIAT